MVRDYIQWFSEYLPRMLNIQKYIVLITSTWSQNSCKYEVIDNRISPGPQDLDFMSFLHFRSQVRKLQVLTTLMGQFIPNFTLFLKLSPPSQCNDYIPKSRNFGQTKLAMIGEISHVIMGSPILYTVMRDYCLTPLKIS